MLNEKGGMSSGGLEQWMENNVLLAYPNLAPKFTFDADGKVKSGPLFVQLDAGPDRYTECSLAWRAEMWSRGCCLFPGIPNGTAGNQLMDDLFGPYKTTAHAVIDNIVSERLAARAQDPTAKVGLDFCDLGRVMNGRPEDPVELRPFMRSFTPEKVRASARRLGLAPIALRTALAHPRVRDDSAEGVRTEVVEQLMASNKASLNSLGEMGFNVAPLTVTLPSDVTKPQSAFIAPPSDLEEQWRLVKAAGGCAGAHWAAVGPRPFNAPQVLGPALERVRERVAEDAAKQDHKAASFAALRESASDIFL